MTRLIQVELRRFFARRLTRLAALARIFRAPSRQEVAMSG